MLRYWFRAFGLGVLPARSVQEWEGKLFGAITPNPQQGWIRVEVLDGKLVSPEARPNQQGRNDSVGKQSGTLVISYSGECPADKKDQVKKLFLNLTWLMFHLGGVGQGARRPCYSRGTRQYAPWWRGSTLIPLSEDNFWELPESVKEFQRIAQKRITNFFEAMRVISGQPINPQQLQKVGNVTKSQWSESVDANCRMVVCSGPANFNKPFALASLHQLGHTGGGKYDRYLCGGVQGGVIPSPVWIADLEDYQVVTVFGATQPPRSTFLTTLRKDANNHAQIWPIVSNE